VSEQGEVDVEPTGEQLEELLLLAEVDTEIRRLHRRLDDLPEQQALDATIAEIEQLEERRADLTLDLDAAQARATKEDREVDMLRQRLAAEQQRMYGGAIHNAKELQSLRAEIASVEQRIDEHETAELEAMEETEGIEGAIAALDDQLATLAVRRDQLEVDRDEAAKVILAEIAELEVTRDRHRSPLPADLLARYDEAAAQFGGTAVGLLDGDRCTACGISLSYADVNALVEGPPLTTCPSCRRLMVVR
jgi:uncharacterized protein